VLDAAHAWHAGNYLDALEEGEYIDINGPTGEIAYKGNGHFDIEGEQYHFDKLNLVAGGSGVTPIWQLIHAVLKNKEDKTEISFIDSNKTYGDILLVDELEDYAQHHKDQFKLWHTLSKKPEDREWKYATGHLDQKMMEEHFHMPSGDKVGTFMCGPPGLIAKGAVPALQKLGFKEGRTMFGF
jgi:nitrate reductase (NAD(P)H)